MSEIISVLLALQRLWAKRCLAVGGEEGGRGLIRGNLSELVSTDYRTQEIFPVQVRRLNTRS
jgi:hypothetical protein